MLFFRSAFFLSFFEANFLLRFFLLSPSSDESPLSLTEFEFSSSLAGRASSAVVAAAAVARAAVRLLLSLTAAASDLHRTILVDLIMPHGFEEPSTPRQAAVPPRTRARVGPCILGSRPESRARSHVAH